MCFVFENKDREAKANLRRIHKNWDDQLQDQDRVNTFDGVKTALGCSGATINSSLEGWAI